MNKKIFLVLAASTLLLTGCSFNNNNNSHYNFDDDDHNYNDDYNYNYNYNDDDYNYDDNYNYDNDDYNYDDDYNYNDDQKGDNKNTQQNDNKNTQKDDDKNNQQEEDNNVQSNRKSFASEARVANETNPLTEVGEVAEVLIDDTSSSLTKSKVYVKLGKTVRRDEAQKIMDKYNEEHPYSGVKVDSSTDEPYVTKLTFDLKDYSPRDYGNGSTFFPNVRYNAKPVDYSGVYVMFGMKGYYEKDSKVKQGDIIDAYVLYAMPKDIDGKFYLTISDSDEKTYVEIDPSTL